MHQAYGDRPLSDGRGHPPNRALADIPGGENAGYAGFKHVWIALEPPSFGPTPAMDQVWTRENETGAVSLHNVSHQVCVRYRPDEDE